MPLGFFMGCLNEICKKDKKWRDFAYSLCQCKMLADDLVNDMYLRVEKYDQVNDWFVMVTIRNLHIDHCKASSSVYHSEDLSYLKDCKGEFEPDDMEKELLDRYEQLNWVQKELIAESYDKSLRQIESTFSLINYAFAHREVTKGRKQILGERFDLLYNNTRRKK